uniref:Secreted protein n=1 Tax=Globodera pallida TaxID=36090 RepID=A0A183C037_GLOPA
MGIQFACGVMHALVLHHGAGRGRRRWRWRWRLLFSSTPVQTRDQGMHTRDVTESVELSQKVPQNWPSKTANPFERQNQQQRRHNSVIKVPHVAADRLIG